MSNRIFFISDTHFNHKNVINYCNRNFETVEDMNAAIIKNWNNTVAKEDIIYFLGDFVFGGVEYINYFTERLQGRKFIITGNHDRKPRLYLEAGFEFASHNPTILENRFILSHQPMPMIKEMEYINIHGHVHNKIESIPVLMKNGRNIYFNVSADVINFTPINFDEIKRYYKR